MSSTIGYDDKVATAVPTRKMYSFQNYEEYAKHFNLLAQAIPGCYVADGSDNSLLCPWILSSFDLDIRRTMNEVLDSCAKGESDASKNENNAAEGEEDIEDTDPLVQIHVEPVGNGTAMLGILNLCGSTRRAAYLSLTSVSKELQVSMMEMLKGQTTDASSASTPMKLEVGTHSNTLLAVAQTSASVLMAGTPEETKSLLSTQTPKVPCITFVVIMEPGRMYNLAYIPMKEWEEGLIQIHKFSFKLQLHPLHAPPPVADSSIPATTVLHPFEPSKSDDVMLRSRDAGPAQHSSLTHAPHPTASVDAHLRAAANHSHFVFEAFPLQETPDQPGFLCTQGFGGRLTHFFSASFHAVDFRCKLNTSCVAVVAGQVVEVEQTCAVSGVHCQNLGHWNSISLRTMDGKYLVDYVHIAPHSATVQVGDVVKAGQVICYSGDIGFAPEPHIHVEVHNAADPTGPSVPFRIRFQSGDGGIEPVAGEWYNSTGKLPPPMEE